VLPRSLAFYWPRLAHLVVSPAAIFHGVQKSTSLPPEWWVALQTRLAEQTAGVNRALLPVPGFWGLPSRIRMCSCGHSISQLSATGRAGALRRPRRCTDTLRLQRTGAGTHEKVLRDCRPELKQFLSTMDLLGEKLGPLLFQFGHFNKKAFPDLDTFLARLVPLLKTLPSRYRFAVEIRNKNWLSAKLADVLRGGGIALALIDQAWMPPTETFKRPILQPADFRPPACNFLP